MLNTTEEVGVVKQPKRLEILYEDEFYIAVNKPVGSLIESDKPEDPLLGTRISEYLEEKYQLERSPYIGVIHRLDRPVCGVVIYGKTARARRKLSNLFSRRMIVKEYLAIVTSPPPRKEEALFHFILKNHEKNISIVSDEFMQGSKGALLIYKFLAEKEGEYLLKIFLRTGRSHQIRAQLAGIGCPVKNDKRYGAKKVRNEYSIGLFSHKLGFVHPITKKFMEIKASVPNTKMWEKFQDV